MQDIVVLPLCSVRLKTMHALARKHARVMLLHGKKAVIQGRWCTGNATCILTRFWEGKEFFSWPFGPAIYIFFAETSRPAPTIIKKKIPGYDENSLNNELLK